MTREEAPAPRLAIYTRSVASGRGAEGVIVTLVRGLRARGYVVDLLLEDTSGSNLEPLRTEGKGWIIDLGAAGGGRLLRTITAIAAIVRLSAHAVFGDHFITRRALHDIALVLFNDRPPLRALRCYVAAERPGAVLAFQNHPNTVLLLTALVCRRLTRLFVSVRNHNTTAAAGKESRWAKAVPGQMRALFWLADGIIAPSKGVADDVTAITGLGPPCLHVIVNPVFRPELVAMSQAPCPHPWLEAGQPPVILGAGKLKPQKDFATLLDAFAEVRGRRPARLIIIGSGKGADALRTQARLLGVADDLDLPGHVDNPFAYYRRAAVFVLSSRWEGLPNVLVEALACGCPVVSTDCPSGPDEVLEGGRYGKLVPVGDVSAMAAAIEAALRDPGDAAARIARAKDFSLERVVEAYGTVLTGAPPPDAAIGGGAHRAAIETAATI